MGYAVTTTTPAARDIDDCAGRNAKLRGRIEAAIKALADDPRPSGAKVLQGALAPQLRVRVGDYRIIYLVDDRRRLVTILRVRKRSDVYG